MTFNAIKTLFIALIFVISGCSTHSEKKDSEPTQVPVDPMAIPSAIPKYEKRTRAGNPKKYTIFGKQYKVLTKSAGYKETGIASWYGTKFHGRKTSNGEIYDMYAMTAAHKTLPIPSYVRVTHLKNKRSVVLRVNDRGPFHEGRIIDLSYVAAVQLGIQKTGTGPVEVIALGYDSPDIKQQTGSQPIFYLQIGAFSSSTNAQQAQQKLNSAEIALSRIQQITTSQGNAVYKVQIGPLYTEQQAQQENEKLLQKGFKNAQLIVENDK